MPFGIAQKLAGCRITCCHQLRAQTVLLGEGPEVEPVRRPQTRIALNVDFVANPLVAVRAHQVLQAADHFLDFLSGQLAANSVAYRSCQNVFGCCGLRGLGFLRRLCRGFLRLR